LILLDTHILLWLVEGDEHLGRMARKRVGDAAKAGDAIISAISFWEIGLLIEKGRMALSMPLAYFAEILVGRHDIKVAPVDSRIAIETAALPSGLHGDPGDRMLVATARHLACPLATTDGKILAYAAQGHVQAINASR
jgi:PIN domain nuclease of toxin-antitoxin system